MKNIEDIVVSKNKSILDVLKIIDKSSKQLALVVDENKKLLGTISDGDIRRALIKKIPLQNSIESIYFKTPTVANINCTKEQIINICTTKKLHQIPIVDDQGSLVGIEILDELISKKNKNNKVILMVGGLGTRLRPLTENIPKPMLHVGGKPILETIVEKFSDYGLTNIIMCIGYKSNIIQNYFGDGSRFGVKIEYVLENKRMGTAGALSLLSKEQLPSEPFFVMNGDLLTNTNFEHLLDYHLVNNSIATMCVREYDYQVPYGVVKIEKGKMKSIEEKPIHKFFISAGIYMLSPDVLDFIPKGQYYDMPSLYENLVRKNKNVLTFPIQEYWLDIGQIDDYKKANEEYSKVF